MTVERDVPAMTVASLDHDSAAALLPWLANGTLRGEERERVERHVRTCLPCRAELAEQTKLRALVERQPAVHLSADAGFERLRGRLDGPAARRPGRSRRALWALAAAVAIAAVGGSIVAGLIGREPSVEPRFGTLSDGASGGVNSALSDVADDGALIDVIFADGVRESQMRELLEAMNAEIVAGPSRTLGRYTLRVPPRNGAPPNVDDVLQRLHDDERVRFAGPTFSLPASAPGASGSRPDSEREAAASGESRSPAERDR